MKHLPTGCPWNQHSDVSTSAALELDGHSGAVWKGTHKDHRVQLKGGEREDLRPLFWLEYTHVVS